MNERDDMRLAEVLRPIPLADDTAPRIAARVAVEVAARRARLLDGALHAGFAVAAVAWALLVIAR